MNLQNSIFGKNMTNYTQKPTYIMAVLGSNNSNNSQ